MIDFQVSKSGKGTTVTARDGTFGEWLGRELEQRRMTQVELASRVGVSPAAVSRWVSGQRVPDILLTERIAAALGIDDDIVLARAGHVRFEEQRILELRQEIDELRARQRKLREDLNLVGRQLATRESELASLEERQPARLVEVMDSLRRVVDQAPLDTDAREQLWEQLGEVFGEVFQQADLIPRSRIAMSHSYALPRIWKGDQPNRGSDRPQK